MNKCYSAKIKLLFTAFLCAYLASCGEDSASNASHDAMTMDTMDANFNSPEFDTSLKSDTLPDADKQSAPDAGEESAPDHCTNGVLDGDELYADCGGSCSCDDGQLCVADCVEGTVCTPPVWCFRLSRTEQERTPECAVGLCHTTYDSCDDCPTGTYCYPGNGTTRCPELQTEDEPCGYTNSGQSSCAGGLFCNDENDRCTPIAQPGEPCGFQNPRLSCVEGYYCGRDSFGENPLCKPLNELGEECDSFSCPPDAYCGGPSFQKRCLLREEQGGPCYGRSPEACLDNLFCTFPSSLACVDSSDCPNTDAPQTQCCETNTSARCEDFSGRLQDVCEPPKGTCQPF